MADLQAFASFLHDFAPNMASSIAEEIVAKSRIIGERPLIERPIAGPGRRQFVIRALNAAYILQYRVEPDRTVILRVFHSRENRE